MCALTGVFATHSHAYGNQLTKVCEYRCPRKVDLYKYRYPDRYYLPWDYDCPPYKNVKISKKRKKR